jgi:hypothetical protein
MAVVSRTRASLRISGDDLEPAALTGALECQPTKAHRKGDVVNGRSKTFGLWLLEASPQEPGDLNGQIREVLAKTTPNIAVWVQLRQRFRVDLFCGIFLDREIEGLSIDASLLEALGSRGIELSLDIYAGPEDA